MRPQTQPSPAVRSLAATATTLMALVAVSASVSAAPAPRAADAEVRAGWGESTVVRVVAAAVAAAARDLAGLERGAVPLGPCPPQGGQDAASFPAPPAPAVVVAPPLVLGECRLDLPPPLR